MRNITTVGVDLAKNVFQVHGVDERGKTVLRKTLKRAEVTSYFARLARCVIGMEACGGAHFWARKLSDLGHTVKLIAPQFVKPYMKSNKNDARDAEAICEAVARPNMRFVPIKNVEQQALLAVHRARQGFVSACTAQSNQIRGLLSEFGIVMPKGIASLGRRMPEILADAENGLPGSSRELFAHFKELSRQVEELERQIKAWHRENSASQRLEAIPGIGPLSASALAASIGDARTFKNGRQFAAWLGLVPRQHSSGGKERLLGISKRGDTYLRTLLIHGACSVLLRLNRHADQAEGWLARLVARRNPNIAAVALANKNARIIWALLAMIGITNADTLQRLPKRRCSSSADLDKRRKFQRNTRHRLHRHLQSDGNQVRPGLTNPARFSGTSRVRGFDQASTSTFHQGPRPSAVHRGRMYGCNLYLGTRTEEEAWQKGTSMYEPATYTSRMRPLTRVGWWTDIGADGVQ